MADPGRGTRLTRALRTRPGRFAAGALAVVLAVPVTLAVLHEGFPLTTADHFARTVWVSNGDRALAGRMNQQIRELTSSVVASELVDIAQDGDDVFTLFTDGVARVDPAFVQLAGRTSVPPGSQVGYGGGRLLLTQPSTGGTWVVDARQPFSIEGAEPTLELGRGGVAAISHTGTVMGYAPADGTLTILSAGAGDAVTRDLVELDGELSMAMVGDRGVILDADARTLLLDDGTTLPLAVADGPLRLQQSGPADAAVLVESVDALVEVDLASGEQRDTDVGGTTTRDVAQLAAPVRVAGCAYGAWTASGRTVVTCGDGEPRIVDLAEQPGDLRFRVNRDEVVLNDIQYGSVFLLDEELTQIADWDVVPQTIPDEDEDGTEEDDDQPADDLAPTRTDENTRPEAVDDEFGARPGQTTILPVLDNDIDRDGDLLVVSAVDQPPPGSGTIELVDGGRALQLTAPEGTSAPFTVRYTTSDGRPNGEASAGVTVDVGTRDRPPVRVRNTSVTVEQGQSVSYNVLADWLDPDGDELYLKSAVATSGDTARSTPDGLVTFTSLTSELGAKTIDLEIADGTEAGPSSNTFTVRVVAPGTLAPIALPDLVTMTAGRPATVSPLANDRNPTSAELLLSALTPADSAVSASLRADGDVALASEVPGTHYVEYTVGAGARSAVGVIRVDVRADTGEPSPPVAVRDVAYLRPEQSVDLAVLANDVSPDGLVLGIQSVEVDPADTTVTVEILNNTLLRVSSSSALAEGAPVSFRYTVSDGGPVTAVASVVVIPVPALLSHQPPLPVPDRAVVRAGDFVDVGVLDNDVHPDGSRMELTGLGSELPADEGFVFLSGDEVRYQAPAAPGTYTVGYEVTDEFGQLGASTVTFTVTEIDEQENRPPTPPILTARVFQGSDVLVELPTTGIDPEGDSVTFGDIASAPALGVVTEPGAQSFRYRAAADASGTDEFEITVTDALGATGVGVVRIGVLPRPDSVLPPSAVDDPIAVRPGRTATVAVLANDSDPSGLSLALVAGSIAVDEAGLDAEIDDIDPNQVVVSVPDDITSGSYYVSYGIANADGVEDTGQIIVQVDPNAPLLPPVAFDHVVGAEEIVDGDRIDVDVLSDARNPSGRISELEVTLVGPGAAAADVGAGGVVSVLLGDARRVVAYTVTNADGLSASAFVVVPDREAALRPRLRLDVAQQEVPSGERREWAVGDLVEAPSGGALRIIDAGSATHAEPGFVVAEEADRVAYRSLPDYSGPASITFQVADGDPEDADTRTAFITVPILVTSTGTAALAPPTFAGGTEQVVVNSDTTVDLASRTVYAGGPLEFDELEGERDGITATIQGGSLVVRAAPGSTGDTATLRFRISGDGIDPVEATLNVVVITDPRPLASAVEDVLETRRPSSSVLYPLANDVNPFPANQPLHIVPGSIVAEDNGAAIVGQPELRESDGRVTVTPTPGFVGTISLRYTIRDSTEDPSREVTGRIRLVYRDVPGNDGQISVGQIGDRQLSPTITAAPRDNNSPIDGYEMTITPSVSPGTKACTFGQPCTWTGLTNGVEYCFTVRAHNAIGWGAEFRVPPRSRIECETPYGYPSPLLGGTLTGNYEGIYAEWTELANDPAGGVTQVRWTVEQTGETGLIAIGAPNVARFVNQGSVAAGGSYTMLLSACNVAIVPERCSAPIRVGPATVPHRPVVVDVRRGEAANFTDAASPVGNRILVQFANTTAGEYLVCVNTTGDSGTHWFHWAKLGRPAEIFGGNTECATGYIDGGGYLEPFGLALPSNQGASIQVWLRYSGTTTPLSGNPDQRWFVRPL